MKAFADFPIGITRTGDDWSVRKAPIIDIIINVDFAVIVTVVLFVAAAQKE
jgi:hypothetical protein